MSVQYKIYFGLSIVIALLIAYIFMLRSNIKEYKNLGFKIDTSAKIIIHDTIPYVVAGKTQQIKEQLIKHDSLIPKVKDLYLEQIKQKDTLNKDYDALYSTYQDIYEKYTALLLKYRTNNIYVNRYSLGNDSSYAIVTDSIIENGLSNRLFEYEVKFPQVNTKETVYITKQLAAPKKVQAFVGGGLTVGKEQTQADAGLILKDKKDRLYYIRAQAPINNFKTISYGASIFIPLNK